MRRRRVLSLPWVLSLALILAGCGLYSFSGSSLPSHIKTIAIPIFQNETLEYEVGNEATDAVTQRFLQDNRLKLVGENRADCVLEAKITKYENKVYNYTAGQTPQDYIVVVRVSATLRDAVKNRDLWKQDDLVASAIYTVTSGSAEPLKDEASARAKALHDLAEDILGRTMEQW